jgi:hypothetical protein
MRAKGARRLAARPELVGFSPLNEIGNGYFQLGRSSHEPLGEMFLWLPIYSYWIWRNDPERAAADTAR